MIKHRCCSTGDMSASDLRDSVKRLFDRFATDGRLLSYHYKHFAAAISGAMEGGDSVEEVLRVMKRCAATSSSTG